MWEDRPTMSCTVLQLDLDDSGECVVFLLEAEKLLIVCEVIAKQFAAAVSKCLVGPESASFGLVIKYDQ